jgi:anaerobic magnesium-protoporphyrin IX monomethyl ester cyclase
MNVVLINTPASPFRGIPPFGVLSLATVLAQNGHDCTVVDADQNGWSASEAAMVSLALGPGVVGISGRTATSYGYVKRLTRQLRRAAYEKWILVGGHVSSACRPLLENADVDLVVHGEGETVLPGLLSQLGSTRNRSGLTNLPIGVYRRDTAHSLHLRRAAQVGVLDSLPFLDFAFLNLDAYLGRPNRTDAAGTDFELLLSRGCANHCSYCYRHFAGLRRHSAEYALDWIEQILDERDISVFRFADEDFLSPPEWASAFVREKKRRKLAFEFVIYGASPHDVVPEVMVELVDNGLRRIVLGFESGSPRMLKAMHRKATVDETVAAYRVCSELGVASTPPVIVGMPGEDQTTVDETIEVLRRIGVPLVAKSVRFPLALPGSPLYTHALSAGLIRDQDAYLEAVSDFDAQDLSLNFTNYPDHVLGQWKQAILHAV